MIKKVEILRGYVSRVYSVQPKFRIAPENMCQIIFQTEWREGLAARL
jgi:hypothetical protein